MPGNGGRPACADRRAAGRRRSDPPCPAAPRPSRHRRRSPLLAVVLVPVAASTSAADDRRGPRPGRADRAVALDPAGRPAAAGRHPHRRTASTRTSPTTPATRGVAILADHGAVWQNHHLMGFGTLNPEPAPGEYDWESLDRRMQLTEETGGRDMLTLCCAPDWMKGGAAGETDWTRLEDGAAARALRRLRRAGRGGREALPAGRAGAGVERAQGLLRRRPEPLGLRGLHRALQRGVPGGEGRAAGRAGRRPVRRARQPRPGGRTPPTLHRRRGARSTSAPLDVVDYWLQHKVGADFVAVDGTTKTRQDTGPPTSTSARRSTPPSTGWLRAAHATCRSGGPSSTRTCPTASRPVRQPGQRRRRRSRRSRRAPRPARGRAAVGPAGRRPRYAALWTDSTEPDGGRPTPLTAAWRWLVPRLAESRVQMGRSPDPGWSPSGPTTA